MNVLKNKYISYINILNIKCIRIGLIYIINVNIKHLFFLELFLVSIIVFLQLNKRYINEKDYCSTIAFMQYGSTILISNN